jgi:transposase
MNKALDAVRSGESHRMKSEGQSPVLKKSRWLLLKREENLKNEQRFRLRDLLRYNLKTVRAYLLKEAFQQLWEYNSPIWAGKFLDEWCRQVMRSRIEPMKKIARSLRDHRELILNYFRAQKLLSSGGVEGLNNKAKVTMRKSYGFRTFRCLEGVTGFRVTLSKNSFREITKVCNGGPKSAHIIEKAPACTPAVC